jgi:hypothetical protein
MSAQQSRIARQFVNVMDRVAQPIAAPVPGFTVVEVKADNKVETYFTREKTSPTGAFWQEWNDLRLRDRVGR